MRLTTRRIAKAIGTLLLLVLIGGGTWFTKPWDDLQSWRWYTMPFERPRAEIFTHWEVIQPVALLQASTNPRQGTVVAQFSTGQPMLFTEDEGGAGPEEVAAVMRTLASRETFR